METVNVPEIWLVPKLPEIDQWEIKRGRCPWCQEGLVSVDGPDMCQGCGAEFQGPLTIED